MKKKQKASRKTKRIPNRKVIKGKGKGGFVTHFTHWISGQEIWASDYGYRAFPIG